MLISCKNFLRFAQAMGMPRCRAILSPSARNGIRYAHYSLTADENAGHSEA